MAVVARGRAGERYGDRLMFVAVGRRSVISCLGRIALVPAAALAVHQLRFALAFGDRASVQLARTGHSYLHSLVPWLVLLIGLGTGAFLWALGRALGGHRSVPRYTLSVAALWVLCSACLVAIYVTQEFLEGLFAAGHPVGLAGIFGYGGWWSIPAALCVGLVLAVVFEGASWVLHEVALRHARGRRPRRIAVLAWPRLVTPVLLRLSPLAGSAAGRAPPAVS